MLLCIPLATSRALNLSTFPSALCLALKTNLVFLPFGNSTRSHVSFCRSESYSESAACFHSFDRASFIVCGSMCVICHMLSTCHSCVSMLIYSISDWRSFSAFQSSLLFWFTLLLWFWISPQVLCVTFQMDHCEKLPLFCVQSFDHISSNIDLWYLLIKQSIAFWLNAVTYKLELHSLSSLYFCVSGMCVYAIHPNTFKCPMLGLSPLQTS